MAMTRTVRPFEDLVCELLNANGFTVVADRGQLHKSIREYNEVASKQVKALTR